MGFLRHDLSFQRHSRSRIRPARALPARRGQGAPIRQRRSSGLRRRFGARELRVLALALLLGTIAWGQMLGSRPAIAPPHSAS